MAHRYHWITDINWRHINFTVYRFDISHFRQRQKSWSGQSIPHLPWPSLRPDCTVRVIISSNSVESTEAMGTWHDTELLQHVQYNGTLRRKIALHSKYSCWNQELVNGQEYGKKIKGSWTGIHSDSQCTINNIEREVLAFKISTPHCQCQEYSLSFYKQSQRIL